MKGVHRVWPGVRRASAAVAALALAGCSGSSAPGSSAGVASRGVSVAPGFAVATIAHVEGARGLVALPNGDLLVGTTGTSLALVPSADGAGAAGVPVTFASFDEGPAAGVAFDGTSVYAATNTTVWKLPYVPGARSARGTALARVRTGSVAPHSDGDVHQTTSVAAYGGVLYVGVGSSCNACVEVDATRASVLAMRSDGSHATVFATRTRNPTALAIDPSTGALFVGGAGQDGLAYGHPYEYLDTPALHGAAPLDYGWPACEENRIPYNALHANPAPDCSRTVVPSIEFPAYATLVGAAYYRADQKGPYAFPAAYRGGIFVTSHGSWHCCPANPPRVYFVAMHGDAPAKAVDWNDPSAQSATFVGGFGSPANTTYAGRPTGIAVGPNGSLFFADDATGNVYRIRPRSMPSATSQRSRCSTYAGPNVSSKQRA